MLKALIKLFRNHQLSAFLGVNALFKPFYRLSYLAAAKECGLFELLLAGPMGFDRLAEIYCKDAKAREALAAWLQLGVRLGQLKTGPDGFALRGLAKELSLPQNDSALALAQEVAGLHYKLISHTPAKLLRGELWSLDDQDGKLIARSSRVMEEFQIEAIDRCFPVSGAVSLLEIGCGSGVYIKHAAARNPSLTAIGLELQPNVADVARRNIQEWGLGDRVRIECGDVRERPPGELFDILTLYNNIYYFLVADRVSLLGNVKRFLKPGGFILLITCCQGGGLAVEALNLWGAATGACGRLPSVEEMQNQLREAGYRNVEAVSLIPGEKFYAFKAHIG